MSKTIAFNPYLPGYEYIPDGEPYVFGDRIYVYGSHDRSHGAFYCLEDYVCWSAPVDNLGDWRYEGVIYEKTQDPLNLDGSHTLFAPDVAVGSDGRYYLYYALDFVGKMAVAVCDEPAGKYEFYDWVHLKKEDGEKEILTAEFPFDPGVLVDDDKRVYLYYGFCPWDFPAEFDHLPQNKRGALMVELQPDMVTIKTEPVCIAPYKLNSQGTKFAGHAFFEASSMRKIKDTYYFIYSSHEGHELCYATSKYPNRDFVYRGVIISNGDIGYQGKSEKDRTAYTGNNHGSIVCIARQWYIFYHRHTQATQFSRQGCAEKIAILADGSIPQVEMTSCGLNDGAMPARGAYSAHICCNLRAKEGAFHVDAMTDCKAQIPHVQEEGEKEAANQYVANLQNETEVGYKYFEFQGNENTIAVTVRGTAAGSLCVYLDGGAQPVMTGQQGILAAQIPVTGCDKQSWQRIEGDFRPEKGIHSLYFVYKGEGVLDFSGWEMK